GIFEHMPAADHFCIVRDVYLPLLTEKPGAVRAHFGHGRFFDLGTLPDYLNAHWALLDEPGASGFFLHGLKEIAPRVWAAPDAHVDDAVTLHGPVLIAAGTNVAAGTTHGPEAVIGRSARVEAGAHLQRCVVWDTARSAGAQANAVITPRGVETVTT
ncbi:MAG: hypothetical protein ACTSXZ_00875, partial [Alphaproteobacteria bacterium]